MNKDGKINRREFIKDISLMGLGLTFGANIANPKNALAQDMSRIVKATHEDATKGIDVNPKIAKQLVDSAIMQYSGQDSVADAWARIFPSFKPRDIIAIKVNCINSSLPSHTEVVDAIVYGLISAGVRENNIIVWDRTNHELIRSGYTHNAGENGVRYFGSDQRGWGYDRQISVAEKNVRLAKIITDSAHIINVPVLKDHGMAGVTLGMKNHYGSVDNPGCLHGGGCDPYIAELNNALEIREKTRLTILDALLGIYVGGPGGAPQFAHNSIIVGQDPVAVDYNGWQIIKSEREKHGMTLPQPAHVKTAAKLGLGINVSDKIIVDNINLKKRYVNV